MFNVQKRAKNTWFNSWKTFQCIVTYTPEVVCLQSDLSQFVMLNCPNNPIHYYRKLLCNVLNSKLAYISGMLQDTYISSWNFYTRYFNTPSASLKQKIDLCFQKDGFPKSGCIYWWSRFTKVSRVACTAEYSCHYNNDVSSTAHQYSIGMNVVKIQPSETLPSLTL